MSRRRVPDREALLARVAARLAGNDFFLAAALEGYRVEHGLSEAELAAHLGCPPEQLTRLALCRQPDDGSPSFREEVEQVAHFSGADPVKLGVLLREVAAIQALRAGEDGAALLAARDLPPDDSGEEQP